MRTTAIRNAATLHATTAIGNAQRYMNTALATTLHATTAIGNAATLQSTTATLDISAPQRHRQRHLAERNNPSLLSTKNDSRDL